jgi:hypothetical protein
MVPKVRGFQQGILAEGEDSLRLNLLVLTGLDQLLFKLQKMIYFLTKQANVLRRSPVLNFPHHLVFPGLTFKVFWFQNN